MMLARGNIRKMRAALADPVAYQLLLGDTTVDMNALVGQTISLRFTGAIHCKICGRAIKKVFGQGFCYPDFINHPENSPCILRPELCEGHLGLGRDPEWERENHVQPHTVYLALTSALKVGVTRDSQIPTRWIDQGAWQAIRLAHTPYRQLAGLIEVALKTSLADKTPWQAMLKGERAEGLDLRLEKERVASLLPPDLKVYYTDNHEIVTMDYPVLAYPARVKSVSFDKEPLMKGKLMGIRGQYLLFDTDRVINLRSFEGYFVELEAE